jgi:hypothetical protein
MISETNSHGVIAYKTECSITTAVRILLDVERDSIDIIETQPTDK